MGLAEPVNAIPEFPEAAQEGFRKVEQFYETWNIGALRLMENSFDSAHIAYVHRKTFGNVASPQVNPREIVQNPWGFESPNSTAVHAPRHLPHKPVQTTN